MARKNKNKINKYILLLIFLTNFYGKKVISNGQKRYI